MSARHSLPRQGSPSSLPPAGCDHCPGTGNRDIKTQRRWLYKRQTKTVVPAAFAQALTCFSVIRGRDTAGASKLLAPPSSPVSAARPASAADLSAATRRSIAGDMGTASAMGVTVYHLGIHRARLGFGCHSRQLDLLAAWAHGDDLIEIIGELTSIDDQAGFAAPYSARQPLTGRGNCDMIRSSFCFFAWGFVDCRQSGSLKTSNHRNGNILTAGGIDRNAAVFAADIVDRVVVAVEATRRFGWPPIPHHLFADQRRPAAFSASLWARVSPLTQIHEPQSSISSPLEVDDLHHDGAVGIGVSSGLLGLFCRCFGSTVGGDIRKPLGKALKLGIKLLHGFVAQFRV